MQVLIKSKLCFKTSDVGDETVEYGVIGRFINNNRLSTVLNHCIIYGVFVN